MTNLLIQDWPFRRNDTYSKTKKKQINLSNQILLQRSELREIWQAGKQTWCNYKDILYNIGVHKIRPEWDGHIPTLACGVCYTEAIRQATDLMNFLVCVCVLC